MEGLQYFTLWSKGEHSSHLLGEQRCGEICLCLLSEVVVFGTLESCLGGPERKSREATSYGISANWEAGARPAPVLKYCSLFGGPKRTKTWRNNSQALKLSSWNSAVLLLLQQQGWHTLFVLSLPGVRTQCSLITLCSSPWYLYRKGRILVFPISLLFLSLLND